NNDLSAVAERIRGLRGEYQALGDDASNVVGGDRDGDDPDQRKKAEEDVKAALSGDKNAATRVQLVLNTIDADQLAGRKPLTSLQASYLSQMQAQQHGMSVDALQAAEKNGVKGLLADSWQLMSNPNIRFPKTDLVPGALDDPGHVVKGG